VVDHASMVERVSAVGPVSIVGRVNAFDSVIRVGRTSIHCWSC